MSTFLAFLYAAVLSGVPLLYGTLGEIITEKAGHLNLGVEGMMYMGGVAGLMGAFLYENSVEAPVPFVGMLIALVCALVCSGLGALIYSVLTISLRANQNVTGLALTTFGMGFGNFFGGSLSRLAGGVGQISTQATASAFRAKIPVLSTLPVVGEVLFSYGFLTYFSIVLTVVLSWFLYRTRKGLNLRAVGENAATADAAGVNVTAYKYLATLVGGMLAGLGGLIAPVFAPLGFGDWRTSTALVCGLVAKESVISTLTVLLGSTSAAALSGMFTVPIAYVFLVFVLLYPPCVAAISTVRSELGGRYAAAVFALQVTVAWIIAFVVHTVFLLAGLL